jgi:transcriptional regulator with GAF, ATPase, and Fis domain
LAGAVVAGRWELVERAGAGATAEVWRALSVAVADGKPSERETVAIKISADRSLLVGEARAIGALDRRWGPGAVDAGSIAPGALPGSLVEVAGGAYLATTWVEGRTLATTAAPGMEEELAAIVAHGVGRALAELHSAGVRHGDVKPSNIVVRSKRPHVDRAEDRGATLIDLGLVSSVGDAARGGTARYASPELREAPERAGPESDLYALGLVLRELAGAASASEPARWADALLAPAPGGRPSAAWVADRAARWLALREDPADLAFGRRALVRRAYLAVRGSDIARASGAARELTGPTRAWVESAIAWRLRLGDLPRKEAEELGPASMLDRQRWLAAIVGTAAASWPPDETTPESDLAERLLELATSSDPSSWTPDDLVREDDAPRSRVESPWSAGEGTDRHALIASELARPRPDARALAAAEDDVASGNAPRVIVLGLAGALLRRGETGRAWAAVASSHGPEADAMRAEIARRRLDPEAAELCARRALETAEEPTRSRAQATLARLAWDAGSLEEAEARLVGARGASAAEVRALVAYRRGALDHGQRVIDDALAGARDVEASARLVAVRGLLEHARGDAVASAHAFGRAVELAVQAGAVIEEATYLTGLAAAATDAGDLGRALESATRAAILWERLGRGADAARAWLSRASALATVFASHAADDAADEAERRALGSGDRRAAAYARWARVETRVPGDARARTEAIAADAELAGQSPEDRARSGARLLVWAPDAIDDRRITETDAAVARLGAAARWEWWRGRAHAFLTGRHVGRAEDAVAALLALVDVRAPLASRGPALEVAVRLATETNNGEAARRFEAARRAAADTLRERTPPSLLAGLDALPWARPTVSGGSAVVEDHSLAPAQIAQLEAIVRALGTRDRLKPLLEQVLDTMVLWSGVERGLLLLPAPDGRLVARAARNLARRDLTGDQLVLSQSIARKAIELGDAVIATDAFASLGDVHASVHALRLRSVLAVPLIARGETLGVVYLDDRTKKGAFGPRELAWVRLVASQAAMAIADARDQVLLKRAARRAERARAQLATLLSEREAELDATRVELEATRDAGATRYRYDAIAGRSLPMQAMLKLVDRITASEVPVLLVGESGTGKELIARAVHANGPRAHKAFVTENCASVPESLLESALFGHVRGAFTGAHATRAGLFDVADGGTLFLDEIGEMPLSMQAKLLRVLQDGEVRAVGSERTRKVDVRVLGATHRDLEAMVRAGTFREDLMYRLNVITLRIPPLRERADDIPLLVAHFLEKHTPKKTKLRVSRAAMDKLVSFAWPGNVRQLENEIRRAVVLADERIDVSELSAEIAHGGSAAARGAGLDLRSRVDALEADLVREALEKTNGNQTRAAEVLGLSRFGLQKMMKRLNIRAA